MKKLFFIMMGFVWASLVIPSDVNAQSCCATKSACKVLSGEATQTYTAYVLAPVQASCQASVQTKAAQPTVLSAAIIPGINTSQAFIANQLGALISKFMNCDNSNCDPACCVEKGCDPATCDLSKCTESKSAKKG